MDRPDWLIVHANTLYGLDVLGLLDSGGYKLADQRNIS